MKKTYQEVDANARIRDKVLKKEKHIDLDVVNEISKKAEEQGYLLIKKNNVNQALFVQVIHENLEHLIRKKHLTQNEFGFLTLLLPLMEYQTNAIIHKDSGDFMTIADLSRTLNLSRQTVSKSVSNLLDKGLLFEFANVRELKRFSRSVSPRTIFVNPELYYSGDRNKIDGTLAKLVYENDVLEQEGIKLKWKVLKKPNNTFGRLYNRRTYLEFKKD